MGLDVNSPEFLNLRRACEMGNPQGCTIFGAGLSRVPTVSGKRVLKFLRLGCEKVFGCVCGFVCVCKYVYTHVAHVYK
jgi:hypothetical protein